MIMSATSRSIIRRIATAAIGTYFCAFLLESEGKIVMEVVLKVEVALLQVMMEEKR